MDSTADELSLEQKYFDVAWDHREHMRTTLGGAPSAAANAGAAGRIRKDAQARIERIGGPDEAVAFGRIDDEDGERLYVGHHTITDDEKSVLVVNWKAPAATPFYKATHDDAHGLVLKRTFDCSGNTIQSFSDVVFAQLAEDVAGLEAHGVIDDALLDDLNSNRTGTMQDIVRTIQAAQYDVIRAPMDQVLTIQGGPGTGKTAVALHRVSWLLFNNLSHMTGSDVLIVGPTPTFTRYTRMVLPSLGDTSVVQCDINQLHPPVKRGRVEAAAVVKLKGDMRMAELVKRALDARIGLPDGHQRLEIDADGRRVWLSAEDVTRLITRARNSLGTYAERRQLLRELLTEAVISQLPRSVRGVRVSLDPLIERIWPSYTAASFLRELFGSRERMMAAAGDAFTAREVSILYRRATDRISDETWSDADLAVLDEVEHLINGIDDRYAHIVVDEAQDLSPMQLRAIARRSSTGSMTIVGDVAQSTGHWARDGWDDVLKHLPTDLPHVREDLRFGYRVPRQIFDFAARLLPVAAPDLVAPEIVRDGPADPVIHRIDVDERPAVAVRAAMAHAAHGRSVGIICPASCRTDTEYELTEQDVAWRAASAGELGPGVNLVSPQEAKGLEFDATVVVEPEDIVAEDERGHRLLYVALTRTTRYLDIVCVGSSLPLNGNNGSDLSDDPEARALMEEIEEVLKEPVAGQASETGRGGVQSKKADATTAATAGHRSQPFIELGAEEVASLLRETVAPNLWAAVLSRAAELLGIEK